MPSGPTSSLIISHTPGSDRNDFTGEVGVRIGIGTSDIPINWIGYRTHSGNTGQRTVTVYEWFSDTVVATTTIDITGASASTFVWQAVTPFTLLANGYYAVLSNVTAFDGETWTNPGAVTMQSSIVNIYDCYRIPASSLATGTPADTFIGLDLGSGPASEGGYSSMLAFWMGGAGSEGEAVPPSGVELHNLPFWFTPGRLRSM